MLAWRCLFRQRTSTWALYLKHPSNAGCVFGVFVEIRFFRFVYSCWCVRNGFFRFLLFEICLLIVICSDLLCSDSFLRICFEHCSDSFVQICFAFCFLLFVWVCSVCLFVCWFVCLSVCLIVLFLCLLFLLVLQPNCFFVYLFVCLSGFVFVCLLFLFLLVAQPHTTMQSNKPANNCANQQANKMPTSLHMVAMLKPAHMPVWGSATSCK